MNPKPDIRTLFQKYLDNTLSKKEFNFFMDWVQNSENAQKLEGLMKKHWHGLSNQKNRIVREENQALEERYRQISARIEEIENESNHNAKRHLDRKSRFLKFAAVMLLFLGTTLFLWDGGSKGETTPTAITAKPGAVTLKLQDGKVKVIFTEKEEKITDAEGNILGTQTGRQIKYNGTAKTDKLVYNELTVPYGNRFDIVLSDGTKVKLNAGSWIKYPVRFLNNGVRKVYLKGEAYFDVSEDSDNPFVVNANELNVEVLGTEFNMSFYPEDADISTVLVEGSVKIYADGEPSRNTVFIKPEQKASWNKNSKKMTVSEVEIDLYTAWKDGELLFRKTPFTNIRKKLERHFDIVIRNEYRFLEDQVYSASFKNENLHEILEAFQVDTPFEYEYLSNENTIKLTQN